MEDVVELFKDKNEKKEEKEWVEGFVVMLVGGEDSGGVIEGFLFKEYVVEVLGKEEVGVFFKEEEK